MELLLRSILSSLCLLIVFIALLAPTSQHFIGFPAGEKYYNLLQSICHQYPSRSLFIFDQPLGLCSRCFAGYFGVFFASTFLVLRLSYLKRFLLGLLILSIMIIDPIVQLLTNYESNNIIRFLTGFAGGIAFFLIINLFNNLWRDHEKSFTSSYGNILISNVFFGSRNSKIT